MPRVWVSGLGVSDLLEGIGSSRNRKPSKTQGPTPETLRVRTGALGWDSPPGFGGVVSLCVWGVRGWGFKGFMGWGAEVGGARGCMGVLRV